MATKTEVITFLTTPEEKQTIQEEADKLGLTMSAFLLLLVKNWTNGVTFIKKV